MTDLSTANLKRLLDEAAPGPWGARGNYKEGGPRPDTSCQIFSADGKYLGIVHSPHVDLAAAAPALAQEVIRLRGRIEGLILEMETKAANNEWQDPATIASYLKEIILGDTND
ncbi:hypothetical protein HMPREF2996_02430 [Corynebacterium sp. HMSC066C02]|uniref:hypothetical protein n=1 Tax=Corynebacterium sp. HMSC066C02 TaxID=1739500 RepID=UPI0008A61284|nr:hypothetical protein [Corynebacterium sp. HMSC066C02]OFP21974.1 hypothetical protein HMPREF2996_02430 [Corynebacterium sp. HMSC066C02]